MEVISIASRFWIFLPLTEVLTLRLLVCLFSPPVSISIDLPRRILTYLAYFLGLGAAITNLYIKDRNGTFRDVILGYDNRTEYLTDPSNSYFGPIVGRYANRIRNCEFSFSSRKIITTCRSQHFDDESLLMLKLPGWSTASFSIPPLQDLSSAPNSTTIYHVTPNENHGEDTLHGGIAGTSRSGFNLLEHGKNKIVFGLLDYDGVEGECESIPVLVELELSVCLFFRRRKVSPGLCMLR